MVPLTIPSDAAHVVAGQGLAQRTQQRDRAGHRGLVVEVDAGVLRRGVQGGAVLGEERLVGGDDRGTVLHGAQDERPGGLDAADDLDDDVGAGDEVVGVGREQRGVEAEVAAVAAGAAHGDADDVHRAADPGREVVAVLGEQPGHGGAHDAAAEQRDAQRFVRSRARSRRRSCRWSTHRDGHVSEIWSRERGSPDVQGEQVVDRLAAHQDPGAPVPHGDRPAAVGCGCTGWTSDRQ